MDNVEAFQNAVKWLENRKIRIYSPEDRVTLDNIKDPNWAVAFSAYIAELGGSSDSGFETPGERGRVLDWLLTYAIGMEYSDRAEELQKIQVEDASAPPLKVDSSKGDGKRVSLKGRKSLEVAILVLDHKTF